MVEDPRHHPPPRGRRGGELPEPGRPSRQKPPWIPCGMRVMTPFERLLAWAGAVGGFAALLKGLLIGVGNGFVAICPKKKKTLDDAAGLGGAL